MTPTPKQRVLKRWPNAELSWGGDASGYSCDYIMVGKRIIGTGPTPAAAWRDAAERRKK